MMNIVTSSLLSGRNIKYHFMFAICNVLPFCYETFKQKIFKDKKDDYEGSNILFSDKKKSLSCIRFHLPSYPLEMCSISSDTINQSEWSNPISSYIREEKARDIDRLYSITVWWTIMEN
jgi:hypothetical protein